MLLFIKFYVKSRIVPEVVQKQSPRRIKWRLSAAFAGGSIKASMQEKIANLYNSAHLFVAAIRICEHRHSAPPSLEDICKTLSFSMEKGHFLCRKLKEMEIIKIVESASGNRLFIQNHLNLEEIPRGGEGNRFEEELKKFQSTQKALSQKVESIKAEQAEKKKNLFAEMEKKLKQEIEKKSH